MEDGHQTARMFGRRGRQKYEASSHKSKRAANSKHPLKPTKMLYFLLFRNNEAVQFLAFDTSLGDPLIRDGH